MNTLLRYTLTTNPSPLYYTRDSLNPSITNILIAITPNEGEEVMCGALQFRIALGSGAEDLTTADQEISIVPESLQTTWSIERFSAGIYRAFPIAPNKGIKAGEVITFQLQGVVVNEAAGSTLFKIDATLAPPNDSENTEITLTKVRSNLDIEDFSGKPPAIYPEEFCTLSWTTKAASTVVLLPDAPPGLPTNGTYEVSPAVPTTYYLVAYGEGPAVTKTFPVQVTRAKIIEFTSSANSINPGEPVLLQWSVQDAASISISPGDYNDLPPTGTLVVMPLQTTAYSLKVTNVNSEDQRDLVVVVSVAAPEILSFIANPPSFFVPEPVPIELSWDIVNGQVITLSPGTYGPLQQKDSVTVNPIVPTTYTLSASNEGLIDVKQITVSEYLTKEFRYYSELVSLVYITIEATRLPIGSALSMYGRPILPPPEGQIKIPKTTVNKYPDYKLPTFELLTGNTNFTFYVTYYPEGQPNPSNASVKLDIYVYWAEHLVFSPEGKLSLEPIGDKLPKASFTKVFSEEFKIPSS
ncbi:MAG: hypothetical protein AAFP19_00050 [Bacteroidota bacterium]